MTLNPKALKAAAQIIDPSGIFRLTWQECLERAESCISTYLAATPQPLPATNRGALHPDDIAVDRFAAVMKAKLAQKRAEGRGGWDDPAQCTDRILSDLLRNHVEKGDPVDVGNLAMMLHQRGERII